MSMRRAAALATGIAWGSIAGLLTVCSDHAAEVDLTGWGLVAGLLIAGAVWCTVEVVSDHAFFALRDY